MSDTEASSETSPRYTEQDWEEIRAAFMSSIMVETHLARLAENLGVEWPYESPEETPAKYLAHSYDELMMMKGFQKDPAQFDLLIDILKDTMSFDDPFGDMVEHVDSDKEDEAIKIMQKLRIPLDFPIKYCWFSPDTRMFCDAEEIETIENFIRFSQNMAENVVVGGDFRGLLNAIANQNVDGIAQHIPVRVGYNGVFLAEAIGHAVKALTDDEILSLAEKHGATITDEDNARRRKLMPPEVEKAEGLLRQRIEEVLAFFPEQKVELQEKIGEGISLERYFMVVNNPKREAIAVALIGDMVEGIAPKKQAGDKKKKKKKGFFAKLFGG